MPADDTRKLINDQNTTLGVNMNRKAAYADSAIVRDYDLGEIERAKAEKEKRSALEAAGIENAFTKQADYGAQGAKFAKIGAAAIAGLAIAIVLIDVLATGGLGGIAAEAFITKMITASLAGAAAGAVAGMGVGAYKAYKTRNEHSDRVLKAAQHSDAAADITQQRYHETRQGAALADHQKALLGEVSKSTQDWAKQQTDPTRVTAHEKALDQAIKLGAQAQAAKVGGGGPASAV